MLTSQDIIYWLGNGLAGIGTMALAGVSWVVKRQVARMDDYASRISDLELVKAGHGDLAAAIVRIENMHQDGQAQTNQRLDNIYQLLVTLRSSH